MLKVVQYRCACYLPLLSLHLAVLCVHCHIPGVFTPISSFLVLPLRGQWVFVVPFLVGDMVGTSWRCRYCDGFNPRGVDWCQQCGRAFIPNLRQVLFQDQATPVFTPMGGWGAGPGKGTGGEGKGWGKGYGGGGGKDQKGKGGPAGNFGNLGFCGPYGQFGKGDPAGKAGKGNPKGSFGKGGPLGNFGNFGKGGKGDFKGGGPGGANGMGLIAPPVTPGPASLWRGARRKRRKGNPAWDAACAAELVGDGAESFVSALETKDSGKCFAASRHLSGVAAWQRQVCPAAADACLAQAKELSQRGQDLMPPAQQVATLERQLRGKLAEAEKLQQQHSTLLASLDAVAKEGAELERQLEFAKAKSAAAASAPPSVVAPNDFASALQFFLQASTRFLPPEQAGAFGSSLESIQRGLIGDSHPTVPSPMDVGITPSMADGWNLGADHRSARTPWASRGGGRVSDRLGGAVHCGTGSRHGGCSHGWCRCLWISIEGKVCCRPLSCPWGESASCRGEISVCRPGSNLTGCERLHCPWFEVFFPGSREGWSERRVVRSTPLGDSCIPRSPPFSTSWGTGFGGTGVGFRNAGVFHPGFSPSDVSSPLGVEGDFSSPEVLACYGWGSNGSMSWDNHCAPYCNCFGDFSGTIGTPFGSISAHLDTISEPNLALLAERG